MSSKINTGSFYPISSEIHSLTPISKILCILIVILTTLITNNLIVHILMSIVMLFSIIASNIPISMFLKPIWKLKSLIIFIFIINFLLKVNIITSIVVSLKVVILLAYGILLIMTTTNKEIMEGLSKFFYPLEWVGINTKKFVLTISLSLRFIPSIFESGQKILKSESSRGIDFKSATLSGKIKMITGMIVPMFILTLKKSDDVADTMEVKLFDVNNKMSNRRKTRWSSVDTSVLALHLITLVFFLAKEVINYETVLYYIRL